MAKKQPAPEPEPLSEMETIFPEEYTWTLDQFMGLSNALFKLLEGFLTQGLTAENAEEFLTRDFALLAPAIAPIVSEVLAITLRIGPADVAAMSLGRQSALALKILLLNKANREEIKNFFAEFFSQPNSATITH